MGTVSQKKAWRQWAVMIALSLCGALALCMRFAAPQLSEEQQADALTEIVWNLRGSMGGTGVNVTLLFAALVALGVQVWRMGEKSHPPRRALLPVSFLISLVWLMGAAFGIDNTLKAVTASSGQVVKSICYVLGMTYFLYELGQLLFCLLERQRLEKRVGRGKLGGLYTRHPFGVSFCAILLCWLPHLAVAYPGYMCNDAWYQLAQYFGVAGFSSHHPPVHTLLLGTLVRLGLKLESGNLGLYLFVLAQALTEAGVFAYTLLLMKRWESPRWLCVGSFCVIVVSPYYIGYVGLVLKDNLYAAMAVLFVAECICIFREGAGCLSEWKHKFLLASSVVGVILFRNNGAYVLYPTFLALAVYGWAVWWRQGVKKGLVRMAACLLVPALLANGLTIAAAARYGIKKGSIAEALSLPFQQTARYVAERGDEVTEEEARAIRAVLDYDHLAEKYDPRISDPVKATYHNEATREELLNYFSTWLKMFFKHPGVYASATANQSYYLIYPFTQNATIYSDTVLNIWCADATNELLGIAEPEGLSGAKTAARGLYIALAAFPVIGLLSHQATYNLLLIALFVFAAYQKKWKWLLASIPLILSDIIIVLAPVIQGHPRYAFPIIYAMPLLLAYYICPGKTEGKKGGETR